MQSSAATVDEYLAELPPDRRATIEAVREVILKNLGAGFEEGMQYGAISYYVPHRLYPAGYHCDPSKALPFAGLGSQKHHLSLGICFLGEEDDRWFRDAWARTGKKLDMGKCCVRFKKLEDVPLDVVGKIFKRVTMKKFVAYYEACRDSAKRDSAKPPAARKAVRKKAAIRKKMPARKTTGR